MSWSVGLEKAERCEKGAGSRVGMVWARGRGLGGVGGEARRGLSLQGQVRGQT